ncbi:MAG: lipopolysaccharide kinase InaA family protein [Pseudomonadota bacterium]
MNSSLTSINFSDGKRGKLIISPHTAYKNELENWVKSNSYSAFENEDFRMQRHTRKRNKLYTFNHPITKKEVILKVSAIDNQYKFLRRTNLTLSTLFSDYNLRAFKGALLLQAIEVECPTPLMYWVEKNSIFVKKSYYMYEKVQADHSLFTFSELLAKNNHTKSQEIYKQLATKTINIIKRIHDAGFRQGDPHPGNFLVTSSNKVHDGTSKINAEDIHMFIIDLDKFSIAKPLGKTLKRFFDLRCMRRCTLGPYNQTEMLKFYLQDEYSRAWNMVVHFWMRGGFNPFKWFKKPKRGR